MNFKSKTDTLFTLSFPLNVRLQGGNQGNTILDAVFQQIKFAKSGKPKYSYYDNQLLVYNGNNDVIKNKSILSRFPHLHLYKSFSYMFYIQEAEVPNGCQRSCIYLQIEHIMLFARGSPKDYN